jgi:glycosyltransferase involved in cell wall biosynthesis
MRAPTHVGLNLVFLVPGETGGMEVAARELIPELLARAPAGWRFTAFVNREAAAAGGPWSELLPSVTVPVNARSRVQWVLGEQTLLPALARRARIDVLHSMASTAPVLGPFRRVVTVHDLIYARFPEAHAGIRDKGMRVLVPAAARRSHRVIADSRSTRDDLIELLGVPAQRIDVVPLGVGAVRRAAPLPERETRARFDLGERRVLLSLSAKRPHKNLAALIGALARIPGEERPVLVLPGYHTAHEAQLRARAVALGVAGSVRFPAWVSAEELEGLWALSSAFVFPSLYEGFGLPVLEAMAREVPLACADASSLPEVAGDAALLFDPRDEAAIASAIQRLLGDAALARQLRERGLRRVREFSWERTARLTLELRARSRVLIGAQDRLQRVLHREPLRVGREPLRGAAPHRQSRFVDADDRGAHALGVRAVGDGAVHALLDQLGCGVVLARHDDARRATRGRLHDHHAVALAARGQQHAHRAAHLRVHRLRVGEAGRPHDVAQAVLDDRRLQRGALGPVAEKLPPQALDPRRRDRHRGDAERRLLLRDQPRGEQHERVGRVYLRGLLRPRVQAPQHRDGATKPFFVQAPGVQLREAEGTLRDARTQPLHEQPHAAPRRAKVVPPVGAAPHLEPVDHQLEAQ